MMLEHKAERLRLIENHHLHLVRCEKQKKNPFQRAEKALANEDDKEIKNENEIVSSAMSCHHIQFIFVIRS